MCILHCHQNSLHAFSLSANIPYAHSPYPPKFVMQIRRQIVWKGGKFNFLILLGIFGHTNAKIFFIRTLFDNSRRCRNSTTLRISNAGNRRLSRLLMQGVDDSLHCQYEEYTFWNSFSHSPIFFFLFHFNTNTCSYLFRTSPRSIQFYCCFRYCMSSVQCWNFRTICGGWEQSRNIGLSYRSAWLNRLAESIPWNQFLGYLTV